jgi:phage portal protein BeeE
MTSLIQSLRRRPAESSQRNGAPWPQLSLDSWASWFNFGGLSYPNVPTQTLGGNHEEIGGDFRGYIEGAYKSNGVVFACILSRLLVFSEARFQFRQTRNGRPGDLFGTPALKLLEHPWANATTGDLLTRMLQHADLAGNSYTARRSRDRLRQMRPDWVTIIMGSDTRPEADATVDDLDLEVLGYAYHPRGPQAGGQPEILLREEVAHFAPIPDPSANFRGMSWLTPVLREIMADSAATAHKLQFFENGATPNMIVTFDPKVTQGQADEVQAAIRERQAGIANAYETMVLGGGATATVVGADMRQIDFKVTQGHGETRVAAAAGVPPIIVGLSEGLEAATYANYSQAKPPVRGRHAAAAVAQRRRVARVDHRRPQRRGPLVRRPRHPVPAGRRQGRC